MQQNLKKIEAFLAKHHLLSLATNYDSTLSVCSLFYAYDKDSISFVVASSDETTHIKNIKQNPKVAGAIALETKVVAKIEGLQFRGEFVEAKNDSLAKIYFKKFPYALAMSPKLWQIKIEHFKLTDNTLGFGAKLIWERSLE